MDARRPASDHALAARAAAGDDAAFSELAARHRPLLLRAAARRLGGSVHHAEDAVQEALVRALRAMREGKVPAEPRAWLLVIVQRCAADQRRAAKPSDELGEHLPAAGPSTDDAVAERFVLRSVISAMHDLPATQRAAVVGRELEGRSYAELAARQDTTVGAVKSLLVRARRTLAAAPGVHAIGAPVAALALRLRTTRVAELLTVPSAADHGTAVAAVATVVLALAPVVPNVQPERGAPAGTGATAALTAHPPKGLPGDRGERRLVASRRAAPRGARLAARAEAAAAVDRARSCAPSLGAAPTAADLRRAVGGMGEDQAQYSDCAERLHAAWLAALAAGG